MDQSVKKEGANVSALVPAPRGSASAKADKIRRLKCLRHKAGIT